MSSAAEAVAERLNAIVARASPSPDGAGMSRAESAKGNRLTGFGIGDDTFDRLTYTRACHTLEQPSWTRTDEDTDLLIETFSVFRFFSQLTVGSTALGLQEQRKLATSLHLKRFRESSLVFQEGDEPDELYVILRGTVAVVKDLNDGEKHDQFDSRVVDPKARKLCSMHGAIVATLGKGDSFGEAGLISGTPRTATIVTIGHADLITLNRETFHALGLGRRQMVYAPERCRELLQRNGVRSDEDLLPLVQLASAVPFFRQFSDGLVRKLCRNMKYLFVPKHSVVCKEGDYGESFYIVLTGTIGVHKQGVMNEEAQEKLEKFCRDPAEKRFVRKMYMLYGAKVCTLVGGDSFGHQGLLVNTPRNATCVTTSNAELIILQRDQCDLVRAMATQNAVFSMESCKRILRKKPVHRSESDIMFLTYNLVPAVPFLRNIPAFLANSLMKFVTMKYLEAGEVLYSQGKPARMLYIMRGGEVRGYQGNEGIMKSLAGVVEFATEALKQQGASPDNHNVAVAVAKATLASTAKKLRQRPGGSEATLELKQVEAALASLGLAGAKKSKGKGTGEGQASGGEGSGAGDASADPTLQQGKDLQDLRPHDLFGELVCSYLPHDVVGEEAVRGGPSEKYQCTAVARRDTEVLCISRGDFLRFCAPLRKRLVYSPVRCRTTLALPPGKRSKRQLAVVKHCLQHIQMFSGLNDGLLTTLANLATYERFKMEDVVVDQSDPDTCMRVVLAGHGSIHQKGAGITRHLLPHPGLPVSLRDASTARRRAAGQARASSSSGPRKARNSGNSESAEEGSGSAMALLLSTRLLARMKRKRKREVDVPEDDGEEGGSGAGAGGLLATIRAARMARRHIGNFRKRRELGRSQESPAASGDGSMSSRISTAVSRLRTRGVTAKGSMDDTALGSLKPVAHNFYHPLPVTASVYDAQNLIGNTVQFGVCTGILSFGDTIGRPTQRLSDETHSSTAVATTMLEVVRISDTDRGVFKSAAQDLVVSPALCRQLLLVPVHQRDQYTVDLLARLAGSVRFFHQFPTTIIHNLCQVMTLDRLNPDDIVFQQGDVGKAFYVILTGSVRVVQNRGVQARRASEGPTRVIQAAESRPMFRVQGATHTGSRRQSSLGKVVASMFAGDSFGEKALLHEITRTATIVCNEHTELLVITKAHFLSAVQAIPTISYAPETMSRTYHNIMWSNRKLLTSCADMEAQYLAAYEAEHGVSASKRQLVKDLGQTVCLRTLRLHWASLVPLMRTLNTSPRASGKLSLKDAASPAKRGVKKLKQEHVDNLMRRQRRLVMQMLSAVPDFAEVAEDYRPMLADEIELQWHKAGTLIFGKRHQETGRSVEEGSAAGTPHPTSPRTPRTPHSPRTPRSITSPRGGAATPAGSLEGVSEGDVFFVLSGQVRVFTSDKGVDVGEVQEGSTLGGYAAVHGLPCCTYAVASKDAYVARLPRVPFQRLVKKFPTIPFVQRAYAFHACGMLDCLSGIDRCKLFAATSKAAFAHNGTLFKQGDVAAACAVLVKGEARLAVHKKVELARGPFIRRKAHSQSDVALLSVSQLIGGEDIFKGRWKPVKSSYSHTSIACGPAEALLLPQAMAYSILTPGAVQALVRRCKERMRWRRQQQAKRGAAVAQPAQGGWDTGESSSVAGDGVASVVAAVAASVMGDASSINGFTPQPPAPAATAVSTVASVAAELRPSSPPARRKSRRKETRVSLRKKDLQPTPAYSKTVLYASMLGPSSDTGGSSKAAKIRGSTPREGITVSAKVTSQAPWSTISSGGSPSHTASIVSSKPVEPVMTHSPSRPKHRFARPAPSAALVGMVGKPSPVKAPRKTPPSMALKLAAAEVRSRMRGQHRPAAQKWEPVPPGEHHSPLMDRASRKGFQKGVMQRLRQLRVRRGRRQILARRRQAKDKREWNGFFPAIAV